MKYEPERINRVVRHWKCLHRDVANRKLGAGRKDAPVAISLERAVATNCFRCQRVAINRQIKFAAENLKSADMVGVFVREKNAVELLRDNAALLQAQRQLSRAQPAI